MRHACRQFGPGALYTVRLLRAQDYLWRHLDEPLLHTGPYAELEEGWDWLCRHWLPASGEVPGATPCVEEYLNAP